MLFHCDFCDRPISASETLCEGCKVTVVTDRLEDEHVRYGCSCDGDSMDCGGHGSERGEISLLVLACVESNDVQSSAANFLLRV